MSIGCIEHVMYDEHVMNDKAKHQTTLHINSSYCKVLRPPVINIYQNCTKNIML